jgi:hypothetical protein
MLRRQPRSKVLSRAAWLMERALLLEFDRRRYPVVFQFAAICRSAIIAQGLFKGLFDEFRAQI